MESFRMLPSEVLSIITSYLAGIYIGRLYLTGDSAMHHKLLKQGGATTFRLSLTPAFSSLRVPSLVYSLSSLLDFGLEVDKVLTNHPVADVALGKLPTSLRRLSLRLSVPSSLSSAVSTLDAVLWSTHFPNLLALELSSGPGHPTELLDFSAPFPPLLTKLEIPLLRSAKIRDLPRCLTTLITRIADESSYVDVFESDPLFPPNLETLHLNCVQYGSFFEWLPSDSMRHLLLDWSPPYISDQNFPENLVFCGFEKLPKFLFSLRTAAYRMNRDYIRLLPKTLTSLELTNNSASLDVLAMRQLPRNLKKLSAKIRVSTAVGEMMRALPRGLTSLQGNEDVIYVAEEQLLALPRGLKTEIGVSTEDAKLPNLLLPPHLSALSLALLKDYIHEDITLPSSITLLILHMPLPDAYLARFWPTKLYSLTLSDCPHADVLSTLPTTLEVLHVRFTAKEAPTQALEHLKRIRQIHARFTENEEVPMEWLQSIPNQNLEELDVASAKINWDAEVIETVKQFKKLKTLAMASVTGISDRHLTGLPNTLTSIALSGMIQALREDNYHTLTEKCFASLPKQLVTLSLPPPKIAPSFVAERTPHLQELKFGTSSAGNLRAI